MVFEIWSPRRKMNTVGRQGIETHRINQKIQANRVSDWEKFLLVAFKMCIPNY